MTDLMSEIRVIRCRTRRQYRAVHRRTGQALSGWQGSPDQALTAGEAQLRAQRETVKWRRCLRCGAEFLSRHAGHRLCSARCREDGGVPDFGVAVGRGSTVETDA